MKGSLISYQNKGVEGATSFFGALLATTSSPTRLLVVGQEAMTHRGFLFFHPRGGGGSARSGPGVGLGWGGLIFFKRWVMSSRRTFS